MRFRRSTLFENVRKKEGSKDSADIYLTFIYHFEGMILLMQGVKVWNKPNGI